ncbi:ABC transporter ATP-binding protein [Alicyclobacillus shizuokensis]|uniref:ABC transporter ATP-binding protein n=1 Tax=Alicyclobacillus shizuokensis TaxID=392014 RepID=UPI000836B22C|nr:phosphate ABC transporter ATP-binding protein [Alicyclobacillus shizuokensis]
MPHAPVAKHEPSPWAIEFRGVGRTLPSEDGPKSILTGVSGRLARGRVLTLIGPSGAGKSTLLSLCNLLQTPDMGEVFIWGREVRTWLLAELRRRVGLVMQQPVMLPGTVADNLAVPSRLHGRPQPDGYRLLQQVGLDPSLLQRPAAELSGGQKQRVALARILSNEPDILLVDEGTSGLDRESAEIMERHVRRLVASRSLTVVWVTHDLEQARRMGDETWLMDKGRVVEQGITEAFFEAPQTEIAKRFLRAGLRADRRTLAPGEEDES